MRTHSLGFSTIVALATTLGACSGDIAPLQGAKQTISAAGGTLTFPGGVALAVPAGAVTSDVEVGVELITDFNGAGLEALPDYLSGTPTISLMLTPHGTTFTQPVTLSVPFAGDPGNLVAMRLASPTDDTWEPVGPIRFADGKATLAISGFSVYTLVQAGTCPCFTGSNLRAFYAYGENLVQTAGWRRSLSVHNDTMPSQEMKDQFTAEGEDWRDYFPNEMRSDSVQINYFPPGPQRSVGQLDASSDEVVGLGDRYECRASSRTGYDFVAGFPDLTTESWGTGVANTTITKAQFLTCKALILAAETGPPAHQVGVAARGIPAGETLELDQGGVRFTLAAAESVAFAPEVVAEGATYAITVSKQPNGVECTLDAAAAGTMGASNVLVFADCVEPTPVCVDEDQDGVTTCGPDGISGTSDDDCNDDDPRVFPGATERCNDKDDDCDGAPLVGEAVDSDDDGVPDACDAHPSEGCDVFDLARILEVIAFTGATCTVDTVPAALASELDTFTGAFIDYPDEAFEAVGVGMAGGAWFAISGCYEESGTGYCTVNTRPLLPAGSDVDQQTYERCADVARYACTL